LSASQPRCGARFSSPSSAAMKSATFRLDHTPCVYRKPHPAMILVSSGMLLSLTKRKWR
jgi:hypothetical protein